MEKALRLLVSSQVLFIFAALTSLPVSADHVIAIGLKSGQAELEAFQAQSENHPQGVSILKDHTGKYENDNTFVQLSGHHTNRLKVANEEVVVVLPAKLNYDSLMELLIKIRAARTLGAAQVSVYSASPFKDIVIEGELSSELNLAEMISVAGADQIFEKGERRKLGQVIPKVNVVSQSAYWLGGTNHPELLGQVAAALDKKPYGFEELKADVSQLKGRKIYWFSASKAPVNDHFFATLAQIHWLESQGAVVHLVSPYLPYARSDKPEFHVGVAAQGRLVADLIESVGTQGITVVRAHAPQSLGFFKIHASEISGRTTIVNFLKSQDIECVVSPDAGFQKDATRYHHKLVKAYGRSRKVCLAVMNKERDTDGKETLVGGAGLESIEGKNVVIIDDETASGGTLHQVAQALQNYHPKSIFAVVTHLAGPAHKSLNSEFIQHLAVTNTVPVSVDHPRLTVLSIAPEIANEIRGFEGK